MNINVVKVKHHIKGFNNSITGSRMARMTPWHLADKMAGILQTTFSNAFSPIKVFESCLSLFRFVPNGSIDNEPAWLGNGLVMHRQKCWPSSLTHICVTIGNNESILVPFREHNNDVTQASWRVKSPVIPLVVQQLCRDNNNEHIKYPHYWPFVRGIHHWPMDTPNKRTVTRKAFQVWCDLIPFILLPCKPIGMFCQFSLIFGRFLSPKPHLMMKYCLRIK